MSRALEACGEDEKIGAAYRGALEKDREALSRMEALAAGGDWDGLAREASAFSPARRGVLRGFEGDPLKERLEAARDEVKGCVKELLRYFSADRAACREEVRRTAPLARGLQRLVLAFSQRYGELKRERNLLDYSDLEHRAVELFLREDGSPTPAAREVAARFDEIMIDEYQDINEVQDSLFRAVSREGENLFMVGDVKQSIYGFRRAMPEIFLKARRSFQKYRRDLDRYPAYIVLDRNFRSRKEVADTVNFVFSRLMTQAAGDIDYTGEERLAYGAGYAPKEGCQTELQLIARGGGASPEEAEGAWIAGRIRELVEGGFTVSDGEGERPVRYGDFCILLRSANQYAHGYAQQLQARGIPARASVAGGFFKAAEVEGVLSLLRVIDNPDQDIPLLGVLMSPLYGFSPSDAARLRLEGRERSVYVSLLEGAREDPRCARVVEDVGRYRAVAATMPSDAFLNYLYARTDYEALVLAMENGPERLLNCACWRSTPGTTKRLRFPRGLWLCAVFGPAQAGGLRPADGGAAPPGRERRGRYEHPQVQGAGVPVCIVAGLRQELCQQPAGGRAAPPGAGAGGQAPGTRGARPATPPPPGRPSPWARPGPRRRRSSGCSTCP